MRGGLLNNKLFAPNVLVIARLLSNNTQLIMILRSGSLNEVGYAARLIRGIGIYAIKTSNYNNNLGNFLIFQDKLENQTERSGAKVGLLAWQMRSTFRKIGPKAFTLKPLLSLLFYLLDQVPDEGTIFNFCSIETNLGLLREFREFVNAD